MSARNRIAIVALAAFALIAAYWFLLLSPKKEEVAEAEQRIEQLHASIAEAEQQISIGREAREEFASDYAQLVALGKAVPDGDEQSSLLVQLNRTGLRTGTFFTSLTLESSGAPVPVTGAPSDDPTTIEPSATEPLSEDTASTTGTATDGADAAEAVEGTATAPEEPTEENVAALPIGAEVGEAGLATLPYKLEFSGDFFRLADFIAGIDGMVAIEPDMSMRVDGRLMTIDGFSLTPDNEGDLADLTGSFVVTTFVTPAGEGRTAGATPQGPGSVDAVPVSGAGEASP